MSITIQTPKPATAMSAPHAMLTGTEKAAVLFLCLGEERGAAMMQQLDEADIQRITQAMSRLGTIPASVAEDTLTEFFEQVMQTGAAGGSIDAARKMLLSFLPAEKVDTILKSVQGPVRANDLWTQLDALDEKVIAEYLASEHEQTIAAVLSNLSPDVTARVLPLLGEGRMVEVVTRMIRLEEVPAHLMEQIEEALKTDVLAAADDSANQATRKRMADLFNKIDPKVFAALSTQLEGKLPEEFGAIREKMFTFADMIQLQPQDLALIMRAMQGNTVPVALRGATKELRDHFLAALPARARDMLTEEMANMGPVKVRDARDAQTALADHARKLLEQGAIKLPEEESDDEEYVD